MFFRQSHCKCRALVRSTFYTYTAVMHLNYLLDKRKSESVALCAVIGICLIKFIENFIHCFGCHADTGVAYVDSNASIL